MKPLHKGAVGMLALAAAGLTVWTAAAKLRAVAPPEQASALEQASLELRQEPSLVVPALGMEPARTTLGLVKIEAQQDAPRDDAPQATGMVPVPADLQVRVVRAAKGNVLSIERPGHLVALRLGRERKIAMNRVEWTRKAGETGALTWETTNAKSLDTVRGQIALSGEDTDVAIRDSVVPAVVTSDSASFHLCRGHEDGAGGFVVVCKVEGAAAAASVETRDSREGVWQLAGDRTLVRFDLPMIQEGTDTKVIGFTKAGKGVVVRVEASRVEGESKALLAIGSDSRSQPVPPPLRGCFCRFPIRDTSF